ncbi:MAG: ATP-grasp domain-containing protein [Deltaproteobacteria bacterium]|nr:ATP-grasp domain-containing protein [Deltaproteobacteria bacterium]
MPKQEKSRLLLFPAGPAQREAFIEAKNKGLFIITMDGDENAPCKDMADQFFPVNPANTEAALQLARNLHREQALDGVLLVGSDLPVTCALIAQECGLNGPKLEAAKLTINKYEMKQRLAQHNVPVPPFYKITAPAEICAIMEKSRARQCIIKPNDNCGARGISVIQHSREAEPAFERAWDNRRGEGFLVLEEYMAGPQISIEGIVLGETVHITGIADRNYDKLDLYYPYVIENGADIPCSLPHQAIEEIKQVFTRAVYALGITDCVVKGDMVWNREQAFVIEVAARISGGKFASRLVPEATGINLLSIAMDACMGVPVSEDRFVASKDKFVCVRYFFPQPGIVSNVEGAERLDRLAYIIDKSLPKSGQKFQRITCHADRGGWIVCSGNSRDESRKRVLEAMQSIKINYV